MIKQRLRNVFQVVNPYVLIVGLMSLVIGLITEVLGNILGGAPIAQTLSLLTIGFLVLGFILLLLAPKGEIEAKIEPRTLRTPEEKQRYANRGLIVFVSLYRPIKGKPPAGDHDADWLKAAQDLSYQDLDLEKLRKLVMLCAGRRGNLLTLRQL